MKTGILAIILSLGIFSGAFADDDSVNTHLATSLSVIFKKAGKNNLLNANAYYQTTLFYKGMAVMAFRSKSSNWVGFFKKLSPKDLPEEAQLNIARKFHSYKVQQVSMYINAEGDINYFAELSGAKRNFILQVNPNGSVKPFNCRQARKIR